MAVRIYSLAKELDIDSKELVDVCTRAGIPGKGSALASLTDDEVVRVKDFLKGSPEPAAKPGAAAPVAPVRPTPDAARGGRIKVIVAPKAGPPTLGTRRRDEPEETEAPTTPLDSAAEPPSAPAEAASAGPGSSGSGSAEPATVEPAKPAAASRPGPLANMLRREDYIPPTGSGSIRTLTPGRKDGGSRPGKPSGEGPAPRSKPAVRLAALPTPVQPRQERPKEESPAQKPDMKLPAEVLGAGKLGSKPLADHMRRAERTLDAEKIRARTGPARPATAVPEEETDDKGKRRGGPAAGPGKPILGGREQRQINRRRGAPRRGDDEPSSYRRGIRRSARRSGASTAAPRKDLVEVELPCTVRDLSEASGVPVRDILKILMAEGVMAQINATMEPDMTELVAAELGLQLSFVMAETLEDRVLSAIDDLEDPPESLVPRPPVVTFLGHVDHGKTSLLDKLIGIDVVSRESGGITQHIRAYQIERGGRAISFVDTPGHEAFTEMRARGANVTDIAVLVVAADDGVMPQTEEAISHIKAADSPIVVALNKIDLPGANELRALTSLNTAGLVPSEWGGDTEVVKTSAVTGVGLDALLDTILTVAELNEYKANPSRPGVGVCLESRQDADAGVVATLIVQNGTLRVGDIVVCGDAYGRVKAMRDPLHPTTRLPEAGPSTPVAVTGFDIAPIAGERFYVLDDIAQAREIAESRAAQVRAQSLGESGYQHVTLETLFDRLDGVGEVQTLNLILRADVRGSIEAIKKELSKLDHPEVKLRILQATVGGVSEADVQLANASDAVIIGFNVVPDERARSLAQQYGVEVRRYDIIYKIADDLKAALEGMLRPEQREVELGRALVQQVFKISRLGAVAGCRVIQGTIERGCRCRVIRDSTVVGDYPLETLRREKDDAKEVASGYECGMKLAGFNDIKEGDILDAYRIEQVQRKFDD